MRKSMCGADGDKCEYGKNIDCRGCQACRGLDFLLVSEYGAEGSDPQIVIFKRR